MPSTKTSNTTNSNRSEIMKSIWAKRKAAAKSALAASVAEPAWDDAPVCCCGCGESIEKAKNPAKQRFFRPGHDQRLRGIAARIVRGKADASTMPAVARALKSRLNLLVHHPELAPAFED